MGKKITDKIRELLSPEDLKTFEEAVERLVQEKVALLEEEIQKKYEDISEKYVAKTVAERLEKEKAAILEDYDTKLNGLEKKIVSKLDSFLDHVIVEQISDDMISKIALNETLMPIVEGIKKVYTQNSISLESDGAEKVKELEETVKKVEKQLSEAIASKVEAEERLEKTATYLLISEKTGNLTESQKARVTKMFKDKPFDEVKEKIDTFVEMVVETRKPEKKVEKVEENKKIIDTVISESDQLKEEKKVVPEEPKDGPTLGKLANRFL